MYTGHVALALGARGIRRDLPLWALVLAAQGADWIELALRPFTTRPRWELWSHAVPAVVIAALVAAFGTWVWKRSVGAAATILLIYLSHPVADLATGFKPLWPGGVPAGLLLIEHARVDFAVQGALCVLGWVVYLRSLTETQRRRVSVVLPLAALLVLQATADTVLHLADRRPGIRRVIRSGLQ